MHLIFYVSEASVAGDAAATALKDIVSVAHRRNPENGITGVLFYENGHFIQAIEGETSAVRAMFDRIKADPRHRNMRVLIDQDIAERSFPNWAIDTFFVQYPELVNTETVASLNRVFEHNFSLNTRDLIDFHKRMIDEVDSFKILRFDEDQSATA